MCRILKVLLLYGFRFQSSGVWCVAFPPGNSYTSRLRVNMHLGGSAAVPGGEQDAALSTLVLNVLGRVHDVGDAAQADETAETESPCVRSVTSLESGAGHGALSTCWAVSGRGTAVERGNGSGVLILGAALDLRRHAWVGAWLTGLCIHLLLLNGGGRASVGLLWLLGLRVHLALLLLVLGRVLGCVLLGIGVLVVNGRLLPGDVGGLRILVHGDALFLHCDGMGCLIM